MSEQVASNSYARNQAKTECCEIRASQDGRRLLQDLQPTYAIAGRFLGKPRGCAVRRIHDDLNSQFLAVLSHELRNSLCVIHRPRGS